VTTTAQRAAAPNESIAVYDPARDPPIPGRAPRPRAAELLVRAPLVAVERPLALGHSDHPVAVRRGDDPIDLIGRPGRDFDPLIHDQDRLKGLLPRDEHEPPRRMNGEEGIFERPEGALALALRHRPDVNTFAAPGDEKPRAVGGERHRVRRRVAFEDEHGVTSGVTRLRPTRR